jgi:hypothetical protein
MALQSGVDARLARQIDEELEFHPADGRELSGIFRIGLLRSVLSGTEGDAMRSFRNVARGMVSARSNHEVLRRVMIELESSYRSEYVYKNLLANRLLLAPTQSHGAALLMELKVANSILDALLVGSRSNAYEIKTELDSPAKLRAQIASYKQIAELVTVVTHGSLVEKYMKVLPDNSIGLMAWTASGALTSVRAARADPSGLNHASLFNTLRQEEYVRIAWRQLGHKPQAPSALMYEYCHAILSAMPIEHLVAEHSRELRTRGIRFRREVRDPRLTDIRSLCIQLNPARDQLNRIIEWLEERESVPTLRSRQTVRVTRPEGILG